MMTKKVPKKPTNPPSIQVQRRETGGKKRPDLFARLRNDEHPLDSLLPAARVDREAPRVDEPASLPSSVEPNAGASASNEVNLKDSNREQRVDSNNADANAIRLSHDVDSNDARRGDSNASLRRDSNTRSDASTAITGAEMERYQRRERVDSNNTPSVITSQPDVDSNIPPRTYQPELDVDSIDWRAGYQPLRTVDSTPENARYQQPQPAAPALLSQTPKPSPRPASDLATAPKVASNKPAEKNRWTEYERRTGKEQVNVRVDAALAKRVKVFAVEQNLSIAAVTEIAWTKLMELVDSNAAGPDASNLAPDERRIMMTFKTKSSIINLHWLYTGVFNELAQREQRPWKPGWSPSEDSAGVRFNDVPLAIVEAGILQTQLQKKIGSGRISSFKYYVEEIDKIIQAGIADETIVHMLDYLRPMWSRETGRTIDYSKMNA